VRHREEQEAYCRRFVAPVIAEVELRQLSRLHFARVLAAAPTSSVASHLRRCLTAMVAAGLEEGLLLATQDVLRGVHWRDPGTEGDGFGVEEEGRFVDEADIPTASAVHALAAAAGERVWWRELQVLAVAYSGLVLQNTDRRGPCPEKAQPAPVSAPDAPAPGEPDPDGQALHDPSGLSAGLDVLNVTRGDRSYADSTDAIVDDVVQVQLWYGNYSPDRRSLANLAAHFELPRAPGKTAPLLATVTADRTEVTPTATVRLSLDRAHLEYIPGSLRWRHNTAEPDRPPAYKTEGLADGLLLGAASPLEDVRHGDNYVATVTIQLRVIASAHTVVVSVRRPNATQWSTEVSARLGDSVEYEVAISNAGNAPLCDILVMNNLPPNVSYLTGSTRLLHGDSPRDHRLPDGIVDPLFPTGVGRPPNREVGVQIGDLVVGGVVKIRFSARLVGAVTPNSPLRNVALARALGLPFIYNVAKVRIEPAE
jgi:uncharacterized repeat protein (TIGR01451 family)